MKRANKSSLVVLFLLSAVLLCSACGSGNSGGLDNKKELFRIVETSRETLLSDIENNDFANTLGLFPAGDDTLKITLKGDCVFFYCQGSGFGSNTAYEGFYYVPWDGPAEVGNMSPPYAKYFSAKGEDIREHLEPEGNGWVWYENKVNSDGDNVYYTEKICDNFWYYRLEY